MGGPFTWPGFAFSYVLYPRLYGCTKRKTQNRPGYREYTIFDTGTEKEDTLILMIEHSGTLYKKQLNDISSLLTLKYNLFYIFI